MTVIDFTLTVAADLEHLRELAVSWPTWLKFRPELKQFPMALLLDVAVPFEHPVVKTVLADHGDVQIVQVPLDSTMSQRERMLSSFVFLAPWVVKTKWLLKLDTDCLAVRENADWCAEKQVAHDDAGREPVFWSSSWGYTRPATAIQTLDDWGDGVAGVKEFPRLDLPFDPKARAVTTPGRIISYVFFGRADWLRWASGLCKRLPVPSQDTFLFFLAKRRGEFYRTSRMHRLGWEHRRIEC